MNEIICRLLSVRAPIVRIENIIHCREIPKALKPIFIRIYLHSIRGIRTQTKRLIDYHGICSANVLFIRRHHDLSAMTWPSLSLLMWIMNWHWLPSAMKAFARSRQSSYPCILHIERLTTVRLLMTLQWPRRALFRHFCHLPKLNWRWGGSTRSVSASTVRDIRVAIPHEMLLFHEYFTNFLN